MNTTQYKRAGRDSRGRPGAAPRNAVRRAFTLIELIVAIGAIALIAVGIAAIFESIGKTVSGGRRVSQLNQFASMIERQMREDIESMTREGVLLIQHSYADADNSGDFDLTGTTDYVVNDSTQTLRDGRIRRIDQLLFFARGEFESARAPVLKNFNATSNEAMIWYGHGMRLDPLEDVGGRDIGGGGPYYDLPQVSDGSYDSNAARARPFDEERALGYADTAYATNPNRFASNWALLRHVTLLKQPGGGDPNLPSENDTDFWDSVGLDSNAARARFIALDKDIQIGGQPAASSPFYHLAQMQPEDVFDSIEYVRGNYNADQDRYPMRSSGLVDVITTDLAEIRRHIMDVGVFPWDVYDDGAFWSDPYAAFDDEYAASTDLTIIGNDLLHMHAWMQDLFPVNHSLNSNALSSYVGVRPRYEEVVPDYVGILDRFSDDRTSNYPSIQNYRLADQRMLGSSVFVPRCTEFIVEYSFGETFSDITDASFGQFVWHGFARTESFDGGDRVAALPYPHAEDPINGDVTIENHTINVPRLDGTSLTRTLQPEVLYGETGNVAYFREFDRPLTAHFGYTDPTYSPGGNNDPTTVPWAWPKLLRVTMSLADPIDPTIEQTFQFVFEIPEGKSAF